jgi:aryl-alcohol dehydrogenase-like predicted oxidoreductase
MLDFSDISPIGFGAYRISENNPEHLQSLKLAFSSGCNLIDTASNYSNGESETLIGRFLKETSSDAFVMSKAGYMQGQDAMQEWPDKIRLNDQSFYCLDVDFLDRQITRSLKRLDRRFLDVFFLHNPEYYFTHGLQQYNRTKICQLISKAFCYLEDQVKTGRIRYYGISSNTLPFHVDNYSTLNINELLKTAEEVSSSHHFKFVQFPFNVKEDHALQLHAEEKSLLEICREKKIVTIGNRPLNCKGDNGVIRLGFYDEDIKDINYDQDKASIDELLNTVRERLTALGMADEWQSFDVLTVIEKKWNAIGNPEGVDAIYGHFFQFLNSLFEEQLPLRVQELFSTALQISKTYSRAVMTTNARAIEASLVEKGVINKNGLPFTMRMCTYYQHLGINHVLVGMRQPRYVQDFVAGFKPRNSRMN